MFILAALIPGVIGLLISLAAARLGGLAIAMVTIALPIIGVPLAKRLSEFTGGSQGVVGAVLRRRPNGPACTTTSGSCTS